MSDDAGRLADQLIAAEQEERRRLALALHDGPVQSLSGIALMLDAVRGALEAGNVDQAQELLASVVDRQRDAIRSLRDLSFALEPIILRDQGFVPAVRALAEQLGIPRRSASTSTSTPARHSPCEPRWRCTRSSASRSTSRSAAGRRPASR